MSPGATAWSLCQTRLAGCGAARLPLHPLPPHAEAPGSLLPLSPPAGCSSPVAGKAKSSLTQVCSLCPGRGQRALKGSSEGRGDGAGSHATNTSPCHLWSWNVTPQQDGGPIQRVGMEQNPALDSPQAPTRSPSHPRAGGRHPAHVLCSTPLDHKATWLACASLGTES